MKNIKTGESTELRGCIGELENLLVRLDSLGAGIAAIHVDAAIEQLRGNICMVEERIGNYFDPGLISAYVKAPIHE